MDTYGNMGPFSPVNWKGTAPINGVPTFVDKLPLTIGGIAGENIKFGRVVSIDPTKNRREFILGKPTANCVVKGISMLDPTIMRIDPGMHDYYFAGRPMTATTLGLLDISVYDTTQSAPLEGSTVWFRNDNGMLAFNNGTDISANGYTKLNAFVYESLDPNGGKIFFNVPLVVTQTRETSTRAATPTATPAAGAVPAGTYVSLATTTPGARIFYTTDGTDPTAASQVYVTPIGISSAVTIKAIAVPTDTAMDTSAVLTAAYTLQ